MRDETKPLGLLGRTLASVANGVVALWRWLTGVIETTPPNSFLWDAKQQALVSHDLYKWDNGPTESRDMRLVQLGWFFRTRYNLRLNEQGNPHRWYNGEDTLVYPPLTPPLRVQAVGRATVPCRPVSLHKSIQLRKRFDELGLPIGRMARDTEPVSVFEEALANLRLRKGSGYAAAWA